MDVGIGVGSVGVFQYQLEKECGSGGGASLPEAFRSGAKNRVIFRKVGRNIRNNAGLELVDNRDKGDWSIVIQDDGIGFLWMRQV